MPLENCSPQASARIKDSPDAATILASELFDTALEAARITSANAAHLIGVSESLVNRMRSQNYREGVSFTQMLRLPSSFHIALFRVMNRQHGYGRAALRDLLDAAGALAVVGDL